MAFSPDGRLVVTGSLDRMARIWATASGKLLHQLTGHRLPLTTVAFSPDGKRIVTASLDDTARLWEPRTGRLVAALKGHANAVKRVAFSPDGRKLLTWGDDLTLGLWDASSGAHFAFFKGHLDHLSAATFDPTGRRVASAGHDHRAILWKAALGVTRHQLSIKASRVALSPDGAWILLTDVQGQTAYVGGADKFVRRIMKKELKLKYSVTRRWIRFAGRKALVLRGPRLAGQAAVQWIILPRGKHPVLLKMTLDGIAWDDAQAQRVLRDIESALRLRRPWRDTPQNRQMGFPVAGDLVRVRLPAGWKLKKYGPGAHAVFTAPGGGQGQGQAQALVRVLGPDGAVWCDKGNRFPDAKQTTLSGLKAWRYDCPEDDKEQVFYTVRVGRSLVYVALTDSKTKGLSGPITRFPSLLQMRRDSGK